MARLISHTFAQHKPLNHSFLFPRSHPDISKSYQARFTPLQDHGIGVISLNHVCTFLNLAAGRYRTKRWWGRFRLWCPQSQKQVNRLTSSLAPPPPLYLLARDSPPAPFRRYLAGGGLRTLQAPSPPAASQLHGSPGVSYPRAPNQTLHRRVPSSRYHWLPGVITAEGGRRHRSSQLDPYLRTHTPSPPTRPQNTFPPPLPFNPQHNSVQFRTIQFLVLNVLQALPWPVTCEIPGSQIKSFITSKNPL